MTQTHNPALFATEAAYTLWFQPDESRGKRWEPVASADTERELVDKIGIGDRHNGCWLILPSGSEP